MTPETPAGRKAPMDCEIKDPGLAAKGRLRMEWAARSMPVLERIKKTFAKDRPLAGVRIAACLHVTSETANLMETLKLGGADIRLCASNPLSTQDDIPATLVKHHKIPVFAIKGEDHETYYRHILQALGHGPSITMDDGADLVSITHSKRKDLLPGILAGTEETTTGVIRLKSMAADGVLRYPIIAVNDAQTKHLFDNRYGTGQSTLDGILRATNVLLAGLRFVVAGYGMCGKGVAMRARGAGAHVIVTEINPIRAIEAVMDGYDVMPMAAAAPIGDVFLTVTGNKAVIRKEHFRKMKNGAIVANAGHFNVEIDIPALEALSSGKRRVRDFVDEYTLLDGRRINLLGEGRLINLAAAEGHPAMVMDMSFANQALSVRWLLGHGRGLAKAVFPVPPEIDEEIAALKLASMGMAIDKLTPAQKRYLADWREGT
jgi:adenosylhomocysteinase